MPPSDRRRRVSLRITTEDESTGIRILDGELREVDLAQNLGEVEVAVHPGVYAVELKRGREVETHPVLVSNDPVHLRLSRADEPPFASAAPVEGTSTSHESHQGGAMRLSHAPPLARHTRTPPWASDALCPLRSCAP